ncbi:hypothetical protein CRUP_002665 [Coryphaenoides rupestris]|nr:hypothetical protein CRUP_002665 [Coryphaenoides rupestris]
MQAFLNTLAFHSWTGLDLDLSTKRRRVLAWDSMSTSAPNTGGGGGGYNPMVGTTLLYQSHIQEGKKSLTGNWRRPSHSVSVLSEGVSRVVTRERSVYDLRPAALLGCQGPQTLFW